MVIIGKIYAIIYSYENFAVCNGGAMVVTDISISRQLIDKNYTKGMLITPKYIVIHDTNNRDFGANAKFNRDYLSVNSRAKTSAHYIIDEKNIIQLLEDRWRGWHVGDKANDQITNSNSIAVKICVNRGANIEKTMNNMLILTKSLMKKYGISIQNVVRHFDVTEKLCPKIMVEDNPSLWTSFKEALEKDLNNITMYKVAARAELSNVLTELKVKAFKDRTSENIGIIDRNTEILIYEFDGDWAKIVVTGVNSRFGYINKGFVNIIDQKKIKKKNQIIIEPSSIIKEETPVKKVTKELIKKKNESVKIPMRKEGVVSGVTTNIAVRKGPDFTHYVISYLLVDDKVKVVEQQNDWYKVIYDSNRGQRTGYVESKYVVLEES